MSSIFDASQQATPRAPRARRLYLSTTAIATLAMFLSSAPVATAPFGPTALAGDLDNPNGSTLDIAGDITGNGFDVNNRGEINVTGGDILDIDVYNNGDGTFLLNNVTRIGDGTTGRIVSADIVNNFGGMLIRDQSTLEATTEVNLQGPFASITMSGVSTIDTPLVNASGAGVLTVQSAADATITGQLRPGSSGFANVFGALRVDGGL